MKYVLLLLLLTLSFDALPQSGTESATTSDGSTWFVIRDFGQRPEPIDLGTGSFLSFQSRNAAMKWGDWVLLNGGLLDLTDGAEQGDLDLIVYIDGRPSGIALQGRVNKNNPALFPVYDGEIDIGRPYAKFRNMYLSGSVYLPKYECPKSVTRFLSLGKHVPLPVLDCVKVVVAGQDGYIPVFR